MSDYEHLTPEIVEKWTQEEAFAFRKETRSKGYYFNSVLNNVIIIRSLGGSTEEYKNLTPQKIEEWTQVYAEAFLTNAKNIGLTFDKGIYIALQKKILGDKWLSVENYKTKKQTERAQFEKERIYTKMFNSKVVECVRMISIDKKPLSEVRNKIQESYFSIQQLFLETFQKELTDFDFYHVVFNKAIGQIIERAELSEDQKKEILSLRRKIALAVRKNNMSNKEVPFDRIYEIINSTF